jgi:Raf kinase inhibitor-like YbhB/YbcL family protein
MTFRIVSAAFGEGRPIPVRHTADDRDVSPPLGWTGAPEGTTSFALLCEDPDAPAGTWVHWVLYNVPGDSRELPEGIPALADLPDGSAQGVNDFRRLGYGGPSPPPGKAHRYFFRLYALDRAVTVKARPRKEDLLAALKGHVLGQAELVGTYQRLRA